MFVWPIIIGVAVIVPALLYISKVISMSVAILIAALIIIIPIVIGILATTMLYQDYREGALSRGEKPSHAGFVKAIKKINDTNEMRETVWKEHRQDALSRGEMPSHEEFERIYKKRYG